MIRLARPNVDPLLFARACWASSVGSESPKPHKPPILSTSRRDRASSRRNPEQPETWADESAMTFPHFRQPVYCQRIAQYSRNCLLCPLNYSPCPIPSPPRFAGGAAQATKEPHWDQPECVTRARII